MNNRWNYGILFVFYCGGAIREVVTKLILETYSPEAVSSVGALIAVLSVTLFFLLGKQRYKEAIEKENWAGNVLVWLGALSIFTASAMYFSNVAIDRIGPLSYKLIQVIVFPVSVSLLAYVILQEVISRKIVVSTSIALVGFFVFYANHLMELTFGWMGVVAAGVSAVSYAVSLMFVKRLLSQNIIPEKIVAARFLFLSLFSIFILPSSTFDFSFRAGLSLLFLGSLGYAGLFTMFFYGVKDIPATAVNVFIASAPLFSALFSWLLLPDVKYSAVEIIGLLIIIFALAYMFFARDRAKMEPTLLKTSGA